MWEFKHIFWRDLPCERVPGDQKLGFRQDLQEQLGKDLVMVFGIKMLMGLYLTLSEL